MNNSFVKLYRSILENDTDKGYDEYKKRSLELDAEVDKTSKALNGAFPLKGGLQGDEVRNDPKYKKLTKAYDVAFQALRKFNGDKANKKYHRQHAMDKRKARMGK